MAKIEDDRRRQEERKQTRIQQNSHRDRARWPNYRGANRTEPSLPRYAPRAPSQRSSDFEENQMRYDDRNLTRHNSSSLRRVSPQHINSFSRSSLDRFSSGHLHHRETRSGVEPSRDSRPPSHRETRRSPHRSLEISPAGISLYTPQASNPLSNERVSAKERLSIPSQHTPSSPTKEASSMSNQSSATNPTSLRNKSLLASRLSDPRSGLQLSEDRVPAKERLSIQT